MKSKQNRQHSTLYSSNNQLGVLQ